MQSRDEQENIVSTSKLEDLSSVMGLRDLKNKLDAAEAKGAVSHTIAKLPERGKHFTLGGLEFEINFVDVKRGKLHAKLVEGPGVGEIAGELGETLARPDLHSMSVALAYESVHKNNFVNNFKGTDKHIHTSFVTNDDPIDFPLPEGKIIKVTVELVDESEAIGDGKP